MTNTRAAAQWLASIRTALTAESYLQLMTAVRDIANEREIERLDRGHVRLALIRMAGNGNHSTSSIMEVHK